ncbi:MAG: Ribosomal RNA large subunit methyltransferase H [Candidatus Tokpelaia hoelldobleri]|uniref:Ribosomal RNA large subunit methyltransferase H n=1 Tax=Candidatus Tokpelaia hoelldobleri TaxID=1902579 RepID=A0A1U9JVD0_9HYPH|nr:MAG: Ribosomal RNA large subunit methyltransferase H [Candidatus Tokpelaia hoelldoblerii]
MQLSVFAVGRMKKGADYELCLRYFERFSRAVPSLGLNFAGIHEINESRAATAQKRKEEEGAALLSQLAPDSCLIVLDERGKSLSSPVFAQQVAGWRDEGCRQLLIALGGPDGHADSVRRRADLLLSFGAMTWPHQLARILLGEQLYRAATILSGHPYHRV